MNCTNCLRKMLHMYNSWYRCWVWRCDECKITTPVGIPADQLTLFEEE